MERPITTVAAKQNGPSTTTSVSSSNKSDFIYLKASRLTRKKEKIARLTYYPSNERAKVKKSIKAMKNKSKFLSADQDIQNEGPLDKFFKKEMYDLPCCLFIFIKNRFLKS